MITARFATLFGLGEAAPVAPGTVGSLIALPIGFALHWAGGFPLFATISRFRAQVVRHGFGALDFYPWEIMGRRPGGCALGNHRTRSGPQSLGTVSGVVL